MPSDTSSLEDSLAASEGDLSYSEDVRRLLRGGDQLSTSMQVGNGASLQGGKLL